MNNVSLSFYLPEPSSLLHKTQLKASREIKRIQKYLLEISNDILDDENIKDLSYFFTCGV